MGTFILVFKIWVRSMTGQKFLKRAVLVRSFVEFIGRHPFATGILALLGLFGLGLSIVSYYKDRADAEGTTEQVGEVARQIDTLSTEVAQSRHNPRPASIDDVTASAGKLFSYRQTYLSP